MSSPPLRSFRRVVEVTRPVQGEVVCAAACALGRDGERSQPLCLLTDARWAKKQGSAECETAEILAAGVGGRFSREPFLFQYIHKHTVISVRDKCGACLIVMHIISEQTVVKSRKHIHCNHLRCRCALMGSDM